MDAVSKAVDWAGQGAKSKEGVKALEIASHIVGFGKMGVLFQYSLPGRQSKLVQNLAPTVAGFVVDKGTVADVVEFVAESAEVAKKNGWSGAKVDIAVLAGQKVVEGTLGWEAGLVVGGLYKAGKVAYPYLKKPIAQLAHKIGNIFSLINRSLNDTATDCYVTL